MLTHVDKKNNPHMVDISQKESSIRMAKALCFVQLPEVLRSYFVGDEIVLKKGPVFQTAKIAATMAVKKTFEMIPFCHQIPLDSCDIEIAIDNNLKISIQCTVKANYKTGVEMEALHGVMIAALTIYDMCKAVSSNITILETKLVAKTGGKKTLLTKPLMGLVLTGGLSSRMQSPKALLNYKGEAHAKYIVQHLQKYCDQVFLSCKKDQWKDTELQTLPAIIDNYELKSPLNGILSAFDAHPDVNWFVVACDLIHFNERTIESLLANFDENKIATCFKNNEKGFPEPLCALYSPISQKVFRSALDQGTTCPVKILKNENLVLIDQGPNVDLANINTLSEFQRIKNEIH